LNFFSYKFDVIYKVIESMIFVQLFF